MYDLGIPLPQAISERARSYLTPDSSGFYRALVDFIDRDFTPGLPEDYTLGLGNFTAYPGTLNAVLSYMAEKHGMDGYLSEEMDLVTDQEQWYTSMKNIFEKDKDTFYELAKERLHVVSYPFRITPLQYLLPLLGESLTLVDVGSSSHIALPLLNSELLLSQDFQGKAEVLASLPNTTVSVKQGIGVELMKQDQDTEAWTRAGFWRNADRGKRLREFDESTEIAKDIRSSFPMVQADAMEQILAPGSVDAISAIFVAHQLPDPNEFMKTAGKVLKPNGILVVIGSEFVGGSTQKEHAGWKVDVHVNSPEGLKLLATPFYLTENQVTLDRVDLSEWQKYVEYFSK